MAASKAATCLPPRLERHHLRLAAVPHRGLPDPKRRWCMAQPISALAVTDLGDGATCWCRTWTWEQERPSVRLWLRADGVSVMLGTVPVLLGARHRRGGRGPAGWQEVVIRGGYDRIVPTDAITILSRLVVQPHGTGTLYVDDATFMDITTDVLNAPVALTDSIPGRYFGMHVNKWGVRRPGHPPATA